MKKNKVFMVHYKCATCRGNFYFTKAYKHISKLSGTKYYVCKNCELNERIDQ